MFKPGPSLPNTSPRIRKAANWRPWFLGPSCARNRHASSRPRYFVLHARLALVFFIHLSVLGTNLAHHNGAGAVGVVVAAVAAAGAFGFDAFLAKAPEVETARIARPTKIAFFILSSPSTWSGRRSRRQFTPTWPARRDNPPGNESSVTEKARQREPAGLQMSWAAKPVDIPRCLG